MIGVGDFKTTDKTRELVNEVLDSNRLSYGPKCRELEGRFAELHDSKFAVLSNSGTSSLQVALQAMKELHGWEDGTEVLVPAITFVATVNIVLHNRMKPVLVDVEPDYYGMDMSRPWHGRLSDKVRVVIPVHLFGMPSYMRSLAMWRWDKPRQDVKIIEDSCECMFAKHYGETVGSIGDIGCFSMYVAHLVTAGVGGISITSNPDYAAKMRSLVNHGRDGIYISIDDDDNLDADSLREIATRRFNFESIGHSFRITELEAAIALAQLDDWESMIEKRSKNAIHLSLKLRHLGDRIQLPSVRLYTDHSWMMYPIVMRHESKWPICNFLEANDIETREMLRITDQPCYKGLWNPDDYPVAAWINKGGFYVGCHQGLTIDDMDYIAERIDEWCKKN